MKAVTLKVPNMACDGCVETVTSALTELDGVREADVSLSDKTVRVVHEDDVSTDDLLGALETAGYPASLEP